MQKPPKVLSISLIVMSLSFIVLLINGWRQISQHEELVIEGKSLFELIRYSEYSPEGRRNIDILKNNRNVLEVRLLEMLRKRNSISESLYLAVASFLEVGKTFSLLEYRGAYASHCDAVETVLLVGTQNEEITREITRLQFYYKDKNYVIVKDIKKIMHNMDNMDNK